MSEPKLLTDSIVERFMLLFSGLERAHGEYTLDRKMPRETATGKLRGRAVTVQRPVTKELWCGHLDGSPKGLGIIPIREDDSCVWAVIDIDRYDLDLKQICERLAEGPLVPVLSKSGGIHIFLFLKEPLPAKTVRKAMQDWAKALGFGGVEVFPKQTHLDATDSGGWLNMPYYDCAGGHATRVALDREGKPIAEPEAFLALAESKKATKKQVTAYKIPVISKDTSDLPDGPPCLQHLAQLGFPAGVRNNGLFNLGVYLRKSQPDTWKDQLDKLNHQFLKPPLPSREVNTIMKSLDHKGYEYKCQDQPICDHCDKEVCNGRKFGAGNGAEADMPALAHLIKYAQEDGDGEPAYYLDIQGQHVGPLTSEHLLNQALFAKRCFEVTGIVCPRLKGDRWRVIVQKLSDDCQTVIIPADSGPKGQLMERLEQFVTGHQQTTDKEGLLSKRVFFDGENYFFRMKDFIDFMHRNKFYDFETQETAAMIREQGCIPKTFNIKGKCTRVWAVTDITLSKRLRVVDTPDEPY